MTRFLATRRPRLDFDARIKPARNYDAAITIACVAFLVVWSAITLIVEYGK